MDLEHKYTYVCIYIYMHTEMSIQIGFCRRLVSASFTVPGRGAMIIWRACAMEHCLLATAKLLNMLHDFLTSG